LILALGGDPESMYDNTTVSDYIKDLETAMQAQSGGNEPFVVTIGYIASEEKYACDKTYTDIKTAFDAGKQIILNWLDSSDCVTVENAKMYNTDSQDILYESCKVPLSTIEDDTTTNSPSCNFNITWVGDGEIYFYSFTIYENSFNVEKQMVTATT
jgi:hypothetical protein